MAQATVDKIPLGKLLNITDTMAEFVPDDIQGSKAKGWVMYYGVKLMRVWLDYETGEYAEVVNERT